MQLGVQNVGAFANREQSPYAQRIFLTARSIGLTNVSRLNIPESTSACPQIVRTATPIKTAIWLAAANLSFGTVRAFVW
jgi:hypothetical protein